MWRRATSARASRQAALVFVSEGDLHLLLPSTYGSPCTSALPGAIFFRGRGRRLCTQRGVWRSANTFARPADLREQAARRFAPPLPSAWRDVPHRVCVCRGGGGGNLVPQPLRFCSAVEGVGRSPPPSSSLSPSVSASGAFVWGRPRSRVPCAPAPPAGEGLPLPPSGGERRSCRAAMPGEASAAGALPPSPVVGGTGGTSRAVSRLPGNMGSRGQRAAQFCSPHACRRADGVTAPLPVYRSLHISLSLSLSQTPPSRDGHFRDGGARELEGGTLPNPPHFCSSRPPNTIGGVRSQATHNV